MNNVKDFIENVGTHIEAGRNLILLDDRSYTDTRFYDTLSTLLYRLVRTAQFSSLHVRMESIRECTPNLEICCYPDVLAISDPWPWHEWTDDCRSRFYDVVVARYRDLKPIWLQTSCETDAEIEQRYGTATAYKLTGDCVIESS